MKKKKHTHTHTHTHISTHLHLQPHHSPLSLSELSLRSSVIMTAAQTRPTSAGSVGFHPQPPDQSRLCGQCPRSCRLSAACRSSPVLESWCLSESKLRPPGLKATRLTVADSAGQACQSSEAESPLKLWTQPIAQHLQQKPQRRFPSAEKSLRYLYNIHLERCNPAAVLWLCCTLWDFVASWLYSLK